MIFSGWAFPITLNAQMFIMEEIKSMIVHRSNGIFTSATKLKRALAINDISKVAENAVPTWLKEL